MWFQGVAWIVAAAYSIRENRRLLGPAGRGRLHEMDAERAARLLSTYRARWPQRAFLVVAAVYAVAAASQFVEGSWPAGVLAAAGAVLNVLAARAQLAARPVVVGILGERDLPVVGRESSRRRTRRVRLFGALAVASYLACTGLLGLGEWQDWEVATGAALGLGLVALVAFFGLLWSAAWRYGDEQPAR